MISVEHEREIKSQVSGGSGWVLWTECRYSAQGPHSLHEFSPEATLWAPNAKGENKCSIASQRKYRKAAERKRSKGEDAICREIQLELPEMKDDDLWC